MFSRDNAACAREHALLSSPDGAHGVLDLDRYQACLTLRGWTRAQHVEPIPVGWFRGFERDRVVRFDAPPPQPGLPMAAPAPSGRAAEEPAAPPSAAAAALVGAWDGELHLLVDSLRERGSSSAEPWIARLTVVPDGAGYRWALSASRAGGVSHADGSIQTSEGRVRLLGGFDGRSGSLSAVRVDYTVTVNGDALTASGHTTDNRVHRLSLRRAKP